MIIDLAEFTELLLQTGLTPNRCYLCLLLHEKDATSLIRYTERFGVFSDKDFQFLIDEGFIATLVKNSTMFNDIIVQPKFARLVTIDEEEQGEEFWKEYPPWLLIEGVKRSAKACVKEDLIKNYFRAIRGSVSTHRMVMKKLIAWKQKNKGYALMKIANFVGSRHWEELEDEGDSERKKEIEEI